MAYYDVLTAAWNNPTQPPPGVTGVGLTVQMTTQEKLNHVNAWTVVGSIPTSFYVTGDRLFNCIDRTEFFALTAAQQQNLLLMMNTPGPLLGGSGSTNHLAAGMILQYFTNLSGPTIANLTALAKASVVNWCLVNNYPYNTATVLGNLSMTDANAAGLV